MRKKAGCPPKYKTAAEMQKKIDEYFESCGTQYMKDDKGEFVYTSKGNLIVTGTKAPTITGLALALGFCGRQTLLNYQGKPEFMDTITRAKSKVEEYAEGRLYDKDGVNGAKFALKNNFKGWSEQGQQEVEDGSSGIKAFLLATNPSKDAIERLFAEEDAKDIDNGETEED